MGIIKSLAPDDSIRIGWYLKNTSCLGPGNRFALWLQGCERKCKGCIAPEMQPLNEGRTEKISDLALLIKSTGTDGITISGGEPFYQADKLYKLLSGILSVKPETGVIIYTGYKIEELINSGEKYIKELLAHYTDILIDGEYIESLDDDKGLRGSSNQQAHFLSEKYREYEEMYKKPAGRKSNLIFAKSKFQVAGIPSRQVKDILNKGIY